MPLPDSRDTTYDGMTPVKAADLNSIQDQIVAITLRGRQTAVYEIGTGGTPTLTAVSVNGYTLVSNAIEVPGPGRYEVEWGAFMTSTSTTSGVAVELTMAIGAAQQASAANRRYTTSASDSIAVRQSTIVEITTPASQRIGLSVGASAGTPAVATVAGLTGTRTNVLRITRLS